ncbi:WecB/TagA/CpsF family glycosyltransferase [Paenibacillus koleovorans]|uniref:WecB/TagA/CpsF family glycosyltransferase n=1 Tax=Paenibacillus koleovorans TaxID=121608 RepID=UPI000FDB83A6|nr:WecB/TagA/CpsF family glycosyltransferase [Paenibacillus koleovorans]
MNKFSTVHLFGVPFSQMNMADTVRYLTEAMESGTPHQVITANPIMVMTAVNDPGYKAMMKRAELIVPDGTGVVWAASYVGNPVAERVPGIELIQNLFRLGEERGWRVYFLGAAPDVIEAAAANIAKQFPELQIVGVRDGYFGAAQDAEVIEDIRSKAPHLLLVGRSVDGQEPWIDRYKQELQVPVVIGVGGSFDVFSGKTKRAPVLFQKLRLEWFYRLLREPKRYKRMLALPQFAVKVIREKENVQKV